MGGTGSKYDKQGGDHTAAFLGALLAHVETHLAPLTEQGVKKGSKASAAAVLKKEDQSLVVAGTNLEAEWPLLHAEMSCLRNFQALKKADKPGSPKECVILCTHEPSPMSLSALVYGGFDNFYYIFSHADSRDDFSLPHDIEVMSQLFGVQDGAYKKSNSYLSGYSISQLVGELPEGEERAALVSRLSVLQEKYKKMSSTYQAFKAANDIPLK